MKLLRAPLHDTIVSVAGSSTISNVFVRNGGGPTSCNPSIGRGDKFDDDDDADTDTGPLTYVSSSSLTVTVNFSIAAVLAKQSFLSVAEENRAFVQFV